MMGDWRRIDAYLPAIRSVAAADVQRVAGVYLDQNRQTVGTLLPTSAPAARPPARSGR
jgi:predicted Zn-dependent peptidase